MIYKIDCFEKKGTRYIKSIPIEIKNINIKKVLNKCIKKENIDNIPIDKRLKLKLEIKFKIKIPISKYDCYFCKSQN